MPPRDSASKEEVSVCCLFCYKTVEKVSPEEDGELFTTFYKFLCNTKCEGKPISQNTGICGDCSHAIGKVCKISEEIETLQKKLVWNMEQLQGIMKTAGKVEFRVKNFEKCFETQGKDENGEIIVTIKKERMTKAKQCRQTIYDACKKQLRSRVLGTPSRSQPGRGESQEPQSQMVCNSTQTENDVQGGSDEDGDVVMIDITSSEPSSPVPKTENEDPTESTISSSVAAEEVVISPGCSTSQTSKPPKDEPVSDGSKKRSRPSNSPVKNEKSPSTKPNCVPSTSSSVKADSGEPTPKRNKIGRPRKIENESETTVTVTEYKCKFCETIASSAKDLVNHEISFHWGPTALQGKVRCPRCPQLVDSQNQFKHYYDTHLRIDKPIEVQCSTCGAKFTRNSKLLADRALKAHRESVCVPFVCKLCDKRFRFKENLESHMQSRHDIEKRTRPVRKSGTPSVEKKDMRKRK